MMNGNLKIGRVPQGSVAPDRILGKGCFLFTQRMLLTNRPGTRFYPPTAKLLIETPEHLRVNRAILLLPAAWL
jgi:hypothetical protein